MTRLCALVLVVLVGCGGSPRGGGPRDTPRATEIDAGAPDAALPPAPKMSGKILRFEKSKAHLRVDLVGQRDGALEPDGVPDQVYDLELEGPIDAVFLVSTDDEGRPNGEMAADTLVSDEPLPPAVAGLGALGKHTAGIGVAEGGALENDSDGRLPALAPGHHLLALHLSGKDLPKTGGFRVYARFTDGSVVAGPSATSR